MTTGVVCICSRGLAHSRTWESVERNLRDARALGQRWEIEFTHDKPIPDAQNAVVAAALEHDPELIWFVEDDNVIPDRLLVEMVEQWWQGVLDVPVNPPAIVADYPLSLPGYRSLRKTHKGQILFGGMGCLLVPASVFRKIPEPWFHCQEAYADEQTGRIERRPDIASYGGQDVQFFIALQKAGVPVLQTPRDVRHLRVKNDPFIPRTNKGALEVIDL
jgi:hypothetical protein